MKKSIFQGNRSRVWGLVLLAVISVLGISSCEKFDLDKRTPEWLGPSIYDYLKDNHYDTYVKLIEDLGYKDILAKTGSKTLFVADEDAVQRFYQSGKFKKADGTPVSRYEDLSIGQKKMILYGSMLNNVYQVAMLSSSEGPVIGDCMRRLSSASEFDNVPLLSPSDMPQNRTYGDNGSTKTKKSHYSYYIENNKSIRIMRDASVKPMVFMINKFLVTHKMVDSDYDFLFNQNVYDKSATRPNKDKYHSPEDASVNGVDIIVQNIKCLNGFVHKVADVIYTLPNMAEYLEDDNNTQIYYALLSRFSAPYYVGDNVEQLYDRYVKNNLLDTIMENGVQVYPKLQGSVDSLFEMRFFSVSARINPDNGVSTTPGGKVVSDMLLKFDPGWNGYYSTSTSSSNANVALQRNMAVMLVPTDEALMVWWNEGEGTPLKERYGDPTNPCVTVDDVIKDMDGVEDYVILKLIKNNMLNSFTGSVPSKFADVLNDAQDPMGLKTIDIDSVKMCCNGAIYLTNKVMSPTAYRSVSFPTLVNKNLRILNWAVGDWDGKKETGCGYFAYLNSMSAKYSFFVPQENIITDPAAPADAVGRLIYIDPVSFGSTVANAFVFKYDEKNKTVVADIYEYNTTTESVVWTAKLGTAFVDDSKNQVKNRLIDLLDYHIVIGEIDKDSRYSYYQTKGRGTVKIATEGSDTVVYGGYQLEKKAPCKVLKVYDMSRNGNGKTYLIDKPLMTSKKSVYDIVTDTKNYAKFREFGKLMEASGVMQPASGTIKFGSAMNVTVFNTYHYTVYIPTNESLLNLMNLNDGVYYRNIIANDSLTNIWNAAYVDAKNEAKTNTKITADLVMSKVMRKRCSYDTAITEVMDGNNTAADSAFKYETALQEIQKRTQNFVKYHIQDNSLYIGGENKSKEDKSKEYETSYMDASTKMFIRLNITATPTSIVIKDKSTTPKHVLTDDANLYNIMCREYEYKLNGTKPDMLETSSYAVIHYIDGPLCNGEVDF